MNNSSSKNREIDQLEIDGIALDRNAASVLSNDPSVSRNRDRLPAPTDKLLHDHEAGELDGIALDKNAASVLSSHHHLHLSSLPGTDHAASKPSDLPAQKFLQQGEADLSSGRYGSAIRLLRKARHLSGRYSGNAKFAQTLIDDIKRVHPTSRNIEHVHSDLNSERKRRVPEMHVKSGMKWAAKKLSSGKEFRSLYGLLRDQNPRHSRQFSSQRSFDEKSVVLSKSAARTTSLIQDEDVKSQVQRLVQLELSRAERKLEKQNQALIEKEENQIIRAAKSHTASLNARQSVLAQSSDEVHSVPRVLSWQEGHIPPSLKLSWNPQTQLANSHPDVHNSETDSESVQLAAPKYFSSQPEQGQSFSGKTQPNSPVPVINLNLPPGEKLPPGRYALDGSVVPDAAGQLDFVGNLVRVSPPGVL